MFIARETKPPPAAFGGAEMCLRAEGLVGFRSSERCWSNISTRAINISLLRSENRPSRKSLVDQLGANFSGRFRSINFFHNLGPRGGTDLITLQLAFF